MVGCLDEGAVRLPIVGDQTTARVMFNILRCTSFMYARGANIYGTLTTVAV